MKKKEKEKEEGKRKQTNWGKEWERKVNEENERKRK